MSRIETGTTKTRLSPSRGRKIAAFTLVLVAGFAMFAIPAIFFQAGYAGGYTGANLAILGALQLVLVGSVIAGGLRMLRRDFAAIGLTSRRWHRDALLGIAVAVAWAALQFGWLIRATGGVARNDIASILDLMDGRWQNIAWYLPLGILGGGMAEELYNRGFIITILEDILGNSRAATGVAAVFAILFFAAGHLPGGLVEWLDILVPSTAYTILFLHTRRLTAPIVAHATWNAMAVAGVVLLYG